MPIGEVSYRPPITAFARSLIDLQIADFGHLPDALSLIAREGSIALRESSDPYVRDLEVYLHVRSGELEQLENIPPDVTIDIEIELRRRSVHAAAPQAFHQFQFHNTNQVLVPPDPEQQAVAVFSQLDEMVRRNVERRARGELIPEGLEVDDESQLIATMFGHVTRRLAALEATATIARLEQQIPTMTAEELEALFAMFDRAITELDKRRKLLGEALRDGVNAEHAQAERAAKERD